MERSEQQAGRTDPATSRSSNTAREREALILVAEGLSNHKIPARLYLSPLTAKTHVSRLRTKLDARDRAQLVVVAYDSGLIVPGGRTPPDSPPHSRECAGSRTLTDCATACPTAQGSTGHQDTGIWRKRPTPG